MRRLPGNEAGMAITGSVVSEIEHEANIFAMELLMPTAFLKADIKTLDGIDFSDDKDIGKLAKRYRVSHSLMALRLGQLFADTARKARERKGTSMSEWQPIETAPRDGTVIEVINDVMDQPVNAKWGKYTSSWGHASDDFIVVKDFDEFMPIRPGHLVCPTRWRKVRRS